MAGEFKGYGERKGQKEGGIHKPDPDGGIYKLTTGTTTDIFLIKRDSEKPQNDIAEYLAASIFSKTAPGYGAEIELVKNTSPSPENPENKNAFLASKYFKNYTDFFKEAGYKDRPEKLEAIQAMLPGKGYVKKELLKKNQDNSYKYNGYEQSLVTSLLLGDFSVHSGNMGVIGQKDDKTKKLVRIDFGAAFRELKSDINPYQSVKNRIGLEKNYFLRDHPSERIESKEFAAELRKIAAMDLTDTIEQKWQDVKSNFDDKAIKDFGLQLGVSAENLTPDGIKSHFASTLKERQESLKDIATEIDLNIAIKTKDIDKIKEAVKNAVATNPYHCKQIVSNPKETQLQSNYSKETLALLKEALEAKQEKNINVLQSTKPTEKSSDNILLAQEEKTPEKLLDTKVSKDSSIISSIRENIIEKQTEIIKNTIGASNPQIDKMSKAEFTTYLKNPDNKKEINAALQNPEIKQSFEQEIHQVSVRGYKDFHEKFKDELKPLPWDGPNKTDEKTQTVKNAKGEEVTTLTEKTVKTASSFTLSDGTQQNISSYRSIDFPTSIKEGTGPVHMSLALKDSNGQNMKAKDAVYFTAHYDKSGNLTEMTTPQPVKFNGNNPDAPGYIEHDGKIYTLPVTQSKYKEMMKEVGKNQGANIDISQEMEVVKSEPKKNVKQEKTSKIEDFPPKDKTELEQIKEKMRSKSLPPKLDKTVTNIPNKKSSKDVHTI
jgi:hypothetical protein